MVGPPAQIRPPSPPPAARYVFVDLLRGWAVLVMIETHVVNALLAPAWRERPAWVVLSFVNGLVAPSFLFCAGIALAIGLKKRWAALTRPGPVMGKYLARMLFILVVGYSLHVPVFSFRGLQSVADTHAWEVFFQSDILHVISLTLCFLVLLAASARTEGRFLALAAAAAAGMIFLAPVVRGLDYSSTAIWLRPYLTRNVVSQFPLFPWSAFLICGAVTGHLYLSAQERGGESRFMSLLPRWALAMIAVSLVAEALPAGIYPNHNFWNASPEFFFVRLGAVLLALAALHRTGEGERAVLALFGRESLLVYVVHLLIVYGRDYDWSFIRRYGATLDPAGCFALFALLTLAMLAMAWVWHRLKAASRRAAAAVQYTVLAGIVLRFFLT